jgi:hypothetical protein
LLVDLLGVSDQPFQQWWWLVPEILTEPVEHELGLRPEGGAQRSGGTTISSSARWITTPTDYGSPVATTTSRRAESVSSVYRIVFLLPIDTDTALINPMARISLSEDP